MLDDDGVAMSAAWPKGSATVEPASVEYITNYGHGL
jgi:hypothetical protein